MSQYFKDRTTDGWRRNESPRVTHYFICRLPEILRSKPHLTETKLAKLLQKSKTSVSDWIHGRSIPPSDIQELIAQLVGCTNRAEIWQWKGRKLTQHILRMNKLASELEQVEGMLEEELVSIGGLR